MDRLGMVRWGTAPPTSVDEELVIFDDGVGWLVVRKPSSDSAAIGTFSYPIATDDVQTLRALGGREMVIDLLHPPTEGDEGALWSTAWRVASDLRVHPYAVVRFRVFSLPIAPGGPVVALTVAGEGATAVQFELDQTRSQVHFNANGATTSWIEMPAPQTGFVTEDAVGLGGLKTRATVNPQQFGSMVVPIQAPEGVDSVMMQVSGWLIDALPDEREGKRFEARTEPAALA